MLEVSAILQNTTAGAVIIGTAAMLVGTWWMAGIWRRRKIDRRWRDL